MKFQRVARAVRLQLHTQVKVLTRLYRQNRVITKEKTEKNERGDEWRTVYRNGP
ncbi:MAG TPA: hypothetical protein PLZ20_14285 [Nitrospira sp.]|nr:hypothetical protein [Nitrospira sp.]